MSFQCTACGKKSYDKPWKLQRHIRESKKCFERMNPGMHFVQFQCSSCDFASPREPDVARHFSLVHGGTDNPIASGHFPTSSVDASTEDSAHADTSTTRDLLQPGIPRTFPIRPPQSDPDHRSLDLDGTHSSDPSIGSSASSKSSSASSLQLITPPTTSEGSSKIERCNVHLDPSSEALITKRKSPDHDFDRPPVDHKRFCAEGELAYSCGLKATCTNATNIPDDLGHDFESQVKHDDPSTVPGPDHDGLALSILESGGRHVSSYDHSFDNHCEDDQSIADALANIDLRPPENDRTSSATIERGLGELYPPALLRNETRISPLGPSVPLGIPKRKSIDTSSSGIAPSKSSKGSLFGRPSTHSYKPWMAWSPAPGTKVSAARSLHSYGMPAPMLNSVDEELLLSRAWTSEEKSDFYTSLHLTPRKQFSLAAVNDDVGRLRLLVEDLAFDCNHRDHEGRTALIWAAKRGHHQAVDILLCHSWDGVDANAQDDCGMTAIMFACRRGDMHMFESLLSLPTIDLMIQENTGLTALMIAIQCTSDPDSIIIVQDLIAYVQARPEYNTTAAKWHPIFNAQDDDGLTPLHWAVEIGRRDCISALLDTERVDVHMRARNGATPAMHAVGHIASSDVLELLFDRNACNPTVTNVCGETLVEVARRQVQEWNVLLDVLYNFPGASEKRGRLIYNLHLCEDYASHYAGLQNQAIGTPVAAGPGL